MRRMIGRHPLGIWIALFFMLFCLLVAGGGQVLSLLNWDLAIRLQLQENDPGSPDIVQRVLAQIEWGVCVADVFFVLPLFVVGLAGVILRRHWGMVTGMMAAICWIYMFVAYTAQRFAVVFRGGMGQWSDYAGIIAGFALLCLGPCLLIIWGLGANANRFTVPCPHSHILRRRNDRLEPFFLADLLICTGQVLRTIPQVWFGKRLSWNTRPEELARSMTGDKIVTGAISAHRAITIDRPPEMVWPWIAQFGRGAAYYSWDFLDNRGHRHADYLLDVPEPMVGDWHKDLGRICCVEPGTEVVWYDEPDFLGMKTRVAMTFRIDPESSQASRLHFRISIGLPQTSLRARILLRVGLLMDQVMSAEMLRRLKLLIETYEERAGSGETNRSLAPHQRSPWRRASETQAVNETDRKCCQPTTASS
jgi:hypothetical protein